MVCCAVADFDKYSLANVPKGSPRMWVHLVSVCAVVFYTLWVSGGKGAWVDVWEQGSECGRGLL